MLNYLKDLEAPCAWFSCVYKKKKIECTFIHISWITQQFQLRQLNKQSRFWEHTVYISTRSIVL